MWDISNKKHVINFKTKNEPKIKLIDFGAFQIKMQKSSSIFGAFHITSRTFFLNLWLSTKFVVYWEQRRLLVKLIMRVVGCIFLEEYFSILEFIDFYITEIFILKKMWKIFTHRKPWPFIKNFPPTKIAFSRWVAVFNFPISDHRRFLNIALLRFDN